MGNMQEGGGWHAWRRRGDVGGGCATVVGCDWGLWVVGGNDGEMCYLCGE